MSNENKTYEYEVLVEEVHLYSYTVVAKNEEEALEKYQNDEFQQDDVECLKIYHNEPYSCEIIKKD
tara:strand:- start:1453 stop:1650 length:198 start_codon:yes stop_codon:yes gene_type:complete